MANLWTNEIKNYNFRKSMSIMITQDTYFLIFEKIEELTYKPGQFCMVEGSKESLTRKPFTLGMWNNSPTLSVKIVGPSSEKMVKKDKNINVLAPLGNPFTPPNMNGIVLVAASCFAEGIYISKEFSIPIIVSSRLPFEHEFIEFFKSAQKDDRWRLVVGDSEFLKTLDTLNNMEEIEWIFVSGSKSMEKLAKEKIDKKLIYFSLNEYMGCGIGACKSCAVSTKNGIKHVCVNGPVFRSDELWEI